MSYVRDCQCALAGEIAVDGFVFREVRAEAEALAARREIVGPGRLHFAVHVRGRGHALFDPVETVVLARGAS